MKIDFKFIVQTLLLIGLTAFVSTKVARCGQAPTEIQATEKASNELALLQTGLDEARKQIDTLQRELSERDSFIMDYLLQRDALDSVNNSILYSMRRKLERTENLSRSMYTNLRDERRRKQELATDLAKIKLIPPKN